MRGEVTILDGTAWVAIGAQDSGRATKLVGSQRAALLVAATVPAWRTVAIDSDIAATALDARIEQYVVAAGLPADKPIPFTIRGEVAARWHVLEGPPSPGASPHDHTKSAVTGRFDGTATIVGFYSKRHVGVFTHMGHTVHAHILEPRTALSAHADELMVKAGSVLELPR
jgi:acetolactate decarboxylase